MTMLFRWPVAAAVGRVLPKERLYAEAGVTKAVRQRFIKEVERVRWAYKLSEESLRLRGRDEVAEVQVFEIELKGVDVSEAVLAAIDVSVPSPIIFELHRNSAGHDEVRMVAARKEPGALRPKLSGYFTGDWLPREAERSALPPAIDLAGLYAQLLTSLLPLPVRPGEHLSVVIDRVTRALKLEREMSALDKRVRLEPQFSRKVELRRQIRERANALNDLKADPTAYTKDATWRN